MGENGAYSYTGFLESTITLLAITGRITPSLIISDATRFSSSKSTISVMVKLGFAFLYTDIYPTFIVLLIGNILII
tara:strand:- start:95 stop:322 length:228 start_codon:yes stop_codon:yes gene_type:complete